VVRRSSGHACDFACNPAYSFGLQVGADVGGRYRVGFAGSWVAVSWSMISHNRCQRPGLNELIARAAVIAVMRPVTGALEGLVSGKAQEQKGGDMVVRGG